MKTDIFLKNKYTKWYYIIINHAKTNNEIVGKHRHHIIPESFFIHRTRKGPSGWVEGDSDNNDNIVYLFPREHLICHKLLVRMTQGKAKSKMYHGLQFMLAKYDGYSLSGRQYELLQIGLSQSVKDRWTMEEKLKRSEMYLGSKNPFFGKHHTYKNKQRAHERLQGKTYEEMYGEEKANELKKKVANAGEKNGFYQKKHNESSLLLMRQTAAKPKSQAWKDSASKNRKGKVPINKGKTFEELYGKERATELKKKVANVGEKNGFFGKQHTEEQRKKKSAEKLAAPKIKCYHCSKEVDHMNYSRWHGDKCKHKGE
jgi:hypothetical protein